MKRAAEEPDGGGGATLHNKVATRRQPAPVTTAVMQQLCRAVDCQNTGQLIGSVDTMMVNRVANNCEAGRHQGVKRHGGWDRAQSKRRDQQRERRGGSRPRAKERAYNWERNTQAEATGCHGVRRLFIAGLRARRHGTCSPEP